MVKKSREEILQRAREVLAAKVAMPHRPEPGSDEEVAMFLREALENKAQVR